MALHTHPLKWVWSMNCLILLMTPDKDSDFQFVQLESQLKPFPFWGVTRCGALLFHYTIEPFSFLYSDQMHRKTRLERWYRVLTITLCIGNTGRLCFPRLYQAFRVVTQQAFIVRHWFKRSRIPELQASHSSLLKSLREVLGVLGVMYHE